MIIVILFVDVIEVLWFLVEMDFFLVVDVCELEVEYLFDSYELLDDDDCFCIVSVFGFIFVEIDDIVCYIGLLL